MCFRERIRRWRKRRRDRIYEGPSDCIDGGTRIRRDEDAPKEINSRELLKFSCRISTLALVDEEPALVRGVYGFCASAEDGQNVRCSVKCNNPLAVPEGERCEIRPKEFLGDVEKLLRKYNAAQYNGNYYKVSGLPDFYGAELDCEYSSGERLSCYNNQDLFLSPVFVYELCLLFGVEQDNDDA